MENKVKVVQFLRGKMDKYTMRYVYEKGGEVVGAVDVNPAVIGKDIGEIIGCENKNVKVTSFEDAEAMLKEVKPDICVVETMSLIKDLEGPFMLCAKLGINAIIIINKIDLQDSYIEIKEEYSKVGYKVIVTSAKENKGIEEVKEILKNKVSVFSGNSGVGKSSLINAIFDTDKTQEGEVSKKNKKGKNTTTDTKLYEIEENTYIADTPGFSSFEINEIESSELDKYFIEIEKELGNCEFVGCTHIKEEKCGVKQAVQDGKISQGRYERFCEIYNELKDKEKYKWK